MNPDMKVDLMHMTQYMKAVMKGVGWSIVRVGKGKEMSHWQAVNRRVHISVYPNEVLIYTDKDTKLYLSVSTVDDAVKRIKRRFKLD